MNRKSCAEIFRAFMFIVLIAVCFSFISCGDIGAFEEDEMLFSSDGNGGAVLIKVNGYYGKDAVIPEVSPDGESVTAIGSEAFAGSGVASVVLHDGIRAIGARAFASCDGLRTMIIPESVVEIGARAFEGCNELSSLTVSEGNAAYRSEGNCVILRENGALIAGCGGSVMPEEGITSIENGAFYDISSLASVTVPDGVVSIGAYAFYGCSGISEISLPQSLKHLGAYAFNGCSSITEIVVSQGITVLNEGVFRNCAALSRVELPDGLVEISDLAFQGCAVLVDPVFPATIERIGGLAFGGCNAFVHLNIPKSLTEIGDGAFSYCDMLWGVKVEDDNPVFRADANCLILRESGTIVLGTRGSRIPEDETVTAIADRAFFGARMLRNAVIPRNIHYVGKEAFYGCDYLESVSVLGNSAEIGDGAFANCFTLGSVYISKSVAKLGDGIFSGCTSLKEIYFEGDAIPDSRSDVWNGSDAAVKLNCPLLD